MTLMFDEPVQLDGAASDAGLALWQLAATSGVAMRRVAMAPPVAQGHRVVLSTLDGAALPSGRYSLQFAYSTGISDLS